jgi:branched-chain amino acid transport system ATP-binding protein
LSALLEVEGVWAGYRDAIVLRDVALHVNEGELVAVVGANGAGKTTLLSAISGHVPVQRGRVLLAGEDISLVPAHAVPARGLVMVPEGGRLFPFMTVQENLELGAYHRRARTEKRRCLEEAMAFFPRLAERRTQLAGSLSGGERQMCAVARAMMAQPRLLMLDEPSLGLAPIMVERLFELLEQLIRAKGLTVLLVEQNVGDALAMAARGYVLEHGRVVKEGTGAALLDDVEVQHAYLGLSEAA